MRKFLNFIYINYVKGNSELDELKPFARKIIYPAWFVRMLLIYIVSFSLFPIVLIHMWWDKNFTYYEFPEDLD